MIKNLAVPTCGAPGYVHAPATGVAESRLSRSAYGSILRLVESNPSEFVIHVVDFNGI